MNKKLLLIIALLIVLIGGGAFFWNRAHRSPWTPGAADAEKEFSLAYDASMKLYAMEALQHLHRAIELDPDYVAPKIFLFFHTPDKKERDQLAKELRGLKLDNLTPRERFLIRYHLATYDGERDKARAILKEYLKTRPNDPFAIELAGNQAWIDQDLDLANQLYSHLLDVNPNWVTAQNRLGYTAMAQGDFTRAEQQFNTYEFVAPDQANPHDSKAELFTLIGRYKEARAELERALAIRPDFCASYSHLLDVALLEHDFKDARETLDRTAEHCPDAFTQYLKCRLSIWEAMDDQDPSAGWDSIPEACREKPDGDALVLIHRLALASGHEDVADSLEGKMKAAIDKNAKRSTRPSMAAAALAHLEGERALSEGRYEDARKLFSQADKEFLYWGDEQGIFKLYNRVRLAFAEQRLGDTEAANKTLADVLKVNPKYPHAEIEGE